MTIFDVAIGRQVRELPGPDYGVGALAFSPDGTLLAAGDAIDGSVRLWTTSTWSEAAFADGIPSHGVGALAFSPDGRHLAIGRTALGSQSGTVDIRPVPTLDVTSSRTAIAEPGTVHALAYSVDGTTIGAGKGLITLMDASTGDVRARLRGHFRWVSSVAFTPDGHHLVSCGGRDHTLRLWNLDERQEYEKLATTTGAMTAATFLPSGELVTAGRTDEEDPVPSRVEVQGAGAGHVFEVRDFFVASLAPSPDGRLLAASGGLYGPDGTSRGGVEVWNVATGTRLWAKTDYPNSIDAVALSPDGTRLALGGMDRRVWVVDLATGAELWSREMPPRARALAYLDDKTILLGSGNDLLLIDAATGATKRTIEAERFAIGCIAVSPDGKSVALGGSSVQIWDAATWTRRHLLTGHSEIVTVVAFSPDGSRVASGGIDALVKLWDVETGQEMLSLEGHATSITTLAFAPDGSALVSTGRSTPLAGESLLWRATASEPTATPVGFRGRTAEKPPSLPPPSRRRRGER